MMDRMPVSQAAARRLQKMMRDGSFSAGDKLPSQRILADRIGISRPSLREALMTLETLGIVRTYPGRGTFVTAPKQVNGERNPDWRYGSEHDIQHVFEVRVLIESRLARHAAALATLEDITRLTALTDKMETAWARQDLVANVEADFAFHRHVAHCTSNTLFAEMFDQVAPLLAETQRSPIPFTHAQRMSESIAEHRRLVAALNRRDPDVAEQAMAEHIRKSAACAGIEV